MREMLDGEVDAPRRGTPRWTRHVDAVRDTSVASTAVPEGDRRRGRRASTRNTSLRAPTWTPYSIARIARPSCLVLDGDVDAPRRGTPRWARPRGHRARHERRLDSMREMLDGEVDEEHLAGRAHVDAVRDTSAASTACARCSTAMSTRNTSLGAPTWTPCATRAPPRQHARDARRRGRRDVDEEHLAGRAHVDAVRDTSAASTACARC